MNIANCKFLGCCIVFLLIQVAPDDSVASNHIPHTPSVSWRSTDSIEMGRSVGSMGNHSMGGLPVYSPSHFSDRLSSHRDFSDRLSSPRPSSEQHSDSEESAASEETWMHELKQDLEGKVGKGVCADFETCLLTTHTHQKSVISFLITITW